ncbi:hypothetical protein B0J11DRAFT_500210 [Dendryphion nanum]|uniref:Uncharacterized protein n=1 Tax=Dendryphion nanum TaxID=256645 RepID=A0A9P9J1H8_9PLEO|nr:hypothetical protein B0J11DRAFT_500210 [Dendryphion nanum]
MHLSLLLLLLLLLLFLILLVHLLLLQSLCLTGNGRAGVRRETPCPPLWHHYAYSALPDSVIACFKEPLLFRCVKGEAICFVEYPVRAPTRQVATGLCWHLSLHQHAEMPFHYLLLITSCLASLLFNPPHAMQRAYPFLLLFLRPVEALRLPASKSSNTKRQNRDRNVKPHPTNPVLLSNKPLPMNTRTHYTTDERLQTATNNLHMIPEHTGFCLQSAVPTSKSRDSKPGFILAHDK